MFREKKDQSFKTLLRPVRKSKHKKSHFIPERQSLIQNVEFQPIESTNVFENAISPDLSAFLTILNEATNTTQQLSDGKFWYKVPDYLYDEYANLTRQRQDHIRHVFEFAWSK